MYFNIDKHILNSIPIYDYIIPDIFDIIMWQNEGKIVVMLTIIHIIQYGQTLFCIS